MDKNRSSNSSKPKPQIVTPETDNPLSDKNSSQEELKRRGQMPRHDEEIGGA